MPPGDHWPLQTPGSVLFAALTVSVCINDDERALRADCEK